MSVITSLSQSISMVGSFWQNKINGQIFRWNVFFISISLIVLIIKFNDLPPQIPLYYSLPWGSNQLVSTSYIFLLPTLSIIVLLINNCLAVFFTRSIQLLSMLLIIVSLIYTAFSTIALLQIINLVA